MRHPESLRALIYEPNGGASYIYELAMALADRIEVRVATHAIWKRDHPDAGPIAAEILWPIAPTARPLRKLFPRLHNHVAMLRFAGRWRPEVVHFHYFQHALLDYPFFHYLHRRHALVATIHNIAPHGARVVESAAWDRRLFSLFDRLIVHHDNLKELLCAGHGVPENRVQVIPRCLPQGGMFSVETPPRPIARWELGLDNDDFVLLLFGGLRRDKRVDVMIRALALLPKEVKLLVAGSGRGREREIENVMSQVGIPDYRVIRDLRFVPRDRVSLYFTAADVVAMPYENFHGQSANLFTAYVFDKPVIVSQAGVMAETVASDGTGIVLEELTPEAVATAVQEMRAAGANRDWSGNLAQARERYSAERVAEATHALYADVSGNS